MSKGSNRRPTDEKAFGDNYDAIFGKSPIEDHQDDIDKIKLMQACKDGITTVTTAHEIH